MTYIKKRFLTPLNITNYSLNTETCIIRSLELVNRCLLMTISKNSKKTRKKTWDFLKETTFGHKTNHQINEMEINGKCTKDPKIISENFNKFFSDIGKNISDSVTQTVKKPEDYCIYPIFAQINLNFPLTIQDQFMYSM